MHQRFPDLFTPPFVTLLLQGLKPGSSTASDKEIREKEDNARIIKQRGLLRVVGELEAVAIVRKNEGKGVTGEVTWASLRELVRISHGDIVGPCADLLWSAHFRQRGARPRRAARHRLCQTPGFRLSPSRRARRPRSFKYHRRLVNT